MIFQCFYHALWLLAFVLLAPVYVYRLVILGKYRQSTLPRFGFQTIPDYRDKKVIWLHAVSLGEAQIATQFAEAIKAKNASQIIVASSCTETGQEVLAKSACIDCHFYYPFDFLFLIKKLFKRLKPKAIFVMETDLWPSMSTLATQENIPVYLVNAKLSEKSFKQYQRFSFLKKRLFNPVRAYFVQCQTYLERFEALGIEIEKLHLSGNIKLDRDYPIPSKQSLEALSSKMGIDLSEPVIVFASTHPGEEAGFVEVFNSLKQKFGTLQCVLVPRHPERFAEVETLLRQKGVNFGKYSDLIDADPNEANKTDFVLVDAMGVLMDFYALSEVAVVAGSFTDKVGGHNIFEPAFFAKPVIYGPWIFKQPGFHDLMMETGAGIQIRERNWKQSLANTLEDLLKDSRKRDRLGQKAKTAIDESKGMTAKTIAAVEDMQGF